MLERKTPRGQLKSGTVLPATIIPCSPGNGWGPKRAGRLSAEKHAPGTIPHREVRQFSLPDMLALFTVHAALLEGDLIWQRTDTPWSDLRSSLPVPCYICVCDKRVSVSCLKGQRSVASLPYLVLGIIMN